jgi:hypothetical protein
VTEQIGLNGTINHGATNDPPGQGPSRPNASEMARSAPRPPSGLPEVGSCPNCAFALQGARKIENIQASSGHLGNPGLKLSKTPLDYVQ